MRRVLAFSSVLALLFALVPAATGAGFVPAANGQSGAGPRIGLVTDGGALADGGFNEYAWAGVQSGAKAVHGSAGAIVPPGNTAGYEWGIEWFADQGFDVIVTVGFLMVEETLVEAGIHPSVQFIGVDQPVADVAPSNYQGLVFDEAQAGYLAGIVAATMSTTGTIGAVGGMSSIPAVLSYINGYRNGAASVDPEIGVDVAYTDAFDRPDSGDEAASDLIANHEADVVFGVAGGTNLGVFGAACRNGIWAIGVDVDQYLQASEFQGCILTSAEKRVATATSLAIQRFAADGLQSGDYLNDASNDGIGLAPIRDAKTPKGLQEALLTALAGLADESLDPCVPTSCDTP